MIFDEAHTQKMVVYLKKVSERTVFILKVCYDFCLIPSGLS